MFPEFLLLWPSSQYCMMQSYPLRSFHAAALQCIAHWRRRAPGRRTPCAGPTCLHHPPLVQHHDLVALRRRGQPVSYEDAGAALQL